MINEETETTYQHKTHINLINNEFKTTQKGNTAIGEMYAILKAIELIKSNDYKIF